MQVHKIDVLDRIPVDWRNIKEFVEERHENDYYEIGSDNDLIIDEVFFGSRQYLIRISVYNGEISFTDDIVDAEAVLNMGYDIDFNEWNEALNKLKLDVQKYGFRLAYTGNGGNEDYLWYSLITSVKNFSEDNLIKATELWDFYNQERRDIAGIKF